MIDLELTAVICLNREVYEMSEKYKINKVICKAVELEDKDLIGLTVYYKDDPRMKGLIKEDLTIVWDDTDVVTDLKDKFGKDILKDCVFHEE